MQAQSPLALQIYRPKSPIVVLGRANKAEKELHGDCDFYRRRYGGGGAVVLSSDALVVSLGVWVKQPYQNEFYFKKINAAILKLIKDHCKPMQSANFSQRGISDLCIEQKKFAGTSIFRSRHYLLYQASILLDVDINLINKYLAHPSAEPDYRKGRSHLDFLTGLKHHVGVDVNLIEKIFNRYLNFYLRESLAEEMIDPQLRSFKNLYQRMCRGFLDG